MSTETILFLNIFISLLKPENFAPVVALFGIALFMISKKKKRQDIGMIMHIVMKKQKNTKIDELF